MFFLRDSIQAQREMARFGAGLPSIADAADRIAATFGVVVAAYISVSYRRFLNQAPLALLWVEVQKNAEPPA